MNFLNFAFLWNGARVAPKLNFVKFNYFTKLDYTKNCYSSNGTNSGADQKTNLQRFVFGMKKGFALSLIPDNVLIIHNNPFVRILRVVSGICFLLWMSKLYIKLGINLWVILFMAFIHLVYILILSIIKIKHLIYLWRNGYLEVKNSPLDRLATSGLKLVACAKGICVYGIGTGTALGLGLGMDELLLHKGRPPIFRDFLGGALDNTLTKFEIENPNKDINIASNSIKEIQYRLELLKTLRNDLNEMTIDLADDDDKDLLESIKTVLSNEIKNERDILENISNTKLTKSTIINEVYKNGSPVRPSGGAPFRAFFKRFI